MSFFTRFRRKSAAPHEPTSDQTTTQRAPDESPRGRVRRVAAWVVTALAALLVFLALVAPDEMSLITPAAFARIPIEGLIGIAVLIALPPRARRITAAVAGAVLGLLTLVRLLDIGFSAALARPFDPVLDWILLDDAEGFLRSSFGRTGAIIAVIMVVVLVVAVLVFMTLSVLRLTRLLARHRTTALRTVAAFAVVWVVCVLAGAQIVPDVPVASGGVAALVYDRGVQVRQAVQDQRDFVRQSAVDTFHDTPGDELFPALRGKDVILAFVESYGRSAIEHPQMAAQVGAMLDNSTRQLRAAGFDSRSAFLTSPVAGGGSWLPHATLLSGLWINNQQRYDTLVSGQRTTITKAFQRADWRTVAVMPGTVGAWPEGPFYGLDQVYAFKDMGYRGPNFSWATMPDQYALSQFDRTEYAKPGRGPLMTELVLVSSHAPWEPLPRFVNWSDVGDGSIFNSMAAKGDSPESVLNRKPTKVRADYARSIEYSVSTLISYVTTYGNDNTVLIFLGDHQPAPIVTGTHASHDVPIAIVAHDRTVLDRISGWGWQDGLKPDRHAPVWRMDAFRDRFLTAFGSTPVPAGSQSAPVK